MNCAEKFSSAIDIIKSVSLLNLIIVIVLYLDCMVSY